MKEYFIDSIGSSEFLITILNLKNFAIIIGIKLLCIECITVLELFNFFDICIKVLILLIAVENLLGKNLKILFFG